MSRLYPCTQFVSHFNCWDYKNNPKLNSNNNNKMNNVSTPISPPSSPLIYSSNTPEPAIMDISAASAQSKLPSSS